MRTTYNGNILCTSAVGDAIYQIRLGRTPPDSMRQLAIPDMIMHDTSRFKRYVQNIRQELQGGDLEMYAGERRVVRINF